MKPLRESLTPVLTVETFARFPWLQLYEINHTIEQGTAVSRQLFKNSPEYHHICCAGACTRAVHCKFLTLRADQH